MASSAIPYQRGAVLVSRMETTGGFVPYETLFTAMPGFTILGDGRVIVVEPPSEIFPGPALPEVRVRRLTDEGMQTVLARLEESGQLEESASWTGSNALVVDALTTLFTLRTRDTEVVVDVYGLGAPAEQGLADQLTPDEQAAQDALVAVRDDLTDIESLVPADQWADAEWQPYEPQAIRLLIGNADAEEPNPDGSGGAPVEWPGTIPPAELGQESPLQDLRCGVVAGAEASTWYAALRDANVLTRFVHDGHLYRVVPRPLLPDEDLTCGTLEG